MTDNWQKLKNISDGLKAVEEKIQNSLPPSNIKTLLMVDLLCAKALVGLIIETMNEWGRNVTHITCYDVDYIEYDYESGTGNYVEVYSFTVCRGDFCVTVADENVQDAIKEHLSILLSYESQFSDISGNASGFSIASVIDNTLIHYL